MQKRSISLSVGRKTITNFTQANVVFAHDWTMDTRRLKVKNF